MAFIFRHIFAARWCHYWLWLPLPAAIFVSRCYFRHCFSPFFASRYFFVSPFQRYAFQIFVFRITLSRHADAWLFYFRHIFEFAAIFADSMRLFSDYADTSFFRFATVRLSMPFSSDFHATDSFSPDWLLRHWYHYWLPHYWCHAIIDIISFSDYCHWLLARS